MHLRGLFRATAQQLSTVHNIIHSEACNGRVPLIDHLKSVVNLTLEQNHLSVGPGNMQARSQDPSKDV